MTGDTTLLILVTAVEGKKVPAAFDAGRTFSGGGAMLLSLKMPVLTKFAFAATRFP